MRNDIEERVSRFDGKSPDWHLLDILRGVEPFQFWCGLGCDARRKFPEVWNWVKANADARTELAGIRDSEEFIRESRALTIKKITS
jgi:hypothetical protein